MTDTKPQPEPISEERVRELLARRVKALGPSNQESGELAGLLVELLQLRRAALSTGPEPEPLPEWQCPSCGATTRARMADQEPEYQWGVSCPISGDAEPTVRFESEKSARNYMSRLMNRQLHRRTVGEWEVVDD